MPQSFTFRTGSCDPSGGNDHERFAATQEVCTLVAAYGANLGGSGQIPSQDIANDIKGAEQNMSNVKSIYSPAEITANAIISANTAMGQFDTITSTYLQPLSTFNAVVTGVADVRLSNNDVPIFNGRSCVDPPIRPNGVDCVDYGIPGIYRSFLMTSIDMFFNS